MYKILIIEDDKNLAQLTKLALEKENFTVDICLDGAEGLYYMQENMYDLVLLDRMLPSMDGTQVLKEARQSNISTPVIFLTALGELQDKVNGLNCGADDYMVKPVNEEEMLLRIKALLRRSRIANEHRLHIGKVTLDYDALTVAREGISQTLPQKEFYLLYKLLSYPDKIFTRLQLMDEIWGMDSETVDTTVNVHVNRLRKRFEGWQEFEIIAIRGIGYKAVITNG